MKRRHGDEAAAADVEIRCARRAPGPAAPVSPLRPVGIRSSTSRVSSVRVRGGRHVDDRRGAGHGDGLRERRRPSAPRRPWPTKPTVSRSSSRRTDWKAGQRVVDGVGADRQRRQAVLALLVGDADRLSATCSAGLVAVTVTPGSTAPLSSVTWPTMLAASWPASGAPLKVTTTDTSAPHMSQRLKLTISASSALNFPVQSIDTTCRRILFMSVEAAARLCPIGPVVSRALKTRYHPPTPRSRSITGSWYARVEFGGGQGAHVGRHGSADARRETRILHERAAAREARRKRRLVDPCAANQPDGDTAGLRLPPDQINGAISIQVANRGDLRRLRR